MNMVSHPLISVVIPAYNGKQFIGQAIASVLKQTYAKFEIVVADDVSQDNTPEIVRQFQDARIRLIENRENLGLVRNLHQAIQASKGDFICWLNQDDMFYRDKLERQLQALRTHHTVGACFSQKDDIDEKGNRVSRFNPSKSAVAAADHLVQLFGGCYLSAPTMMVKREVYERLGGFDPTYSIAFDYDMWFKLKRHYDIKIIPAPLLCFRHHAGNLSSEKNEPLIAAECAGIIRKNLAWFDIKEIYPFLNQISNGEMERIETSACLLSLALLIWGQKKWNLLLKDDILQLIARALDLNPILIDAYRLGLEVCSHGAYPDIHHLYSSKEAAAVGIYSKFLEQLELAYTAGHQQLMGRIIEKMYAMCPVNGDPYYQLARLSFKAGDCAAARSYCASAVQLNSRHKEARELLATLHHENDPPMRDTPV
jgi:glycosyltransferase involved in cell wall biosynthesis